MENSAPESSKDFSTFINGCYNAVDKPSPRKRLRNTSVVERFMVKNKKLFTGLVRRISEQLEKEDFDFIVSVQKHFPRATWIEKCDVEWSFDYWPLPEGSHFVDAGGELPPSTWETSVSIWGLHPHAPSGSVPGSEKRRLYNLTVQFSQPHEVTRNTQDELELWVGKLKVDTTCHYYKAIATLGLTFEEIDCVGRFIYEELLCSQKISDFHRGYIVRAIEQ